MYQKSKRKGKGEKMEKGRKGEREREREREGGKGIGRKKQTATVLDQKALKSHGHLTQCVIQAGLVLNSQKTFFFF